MQQSLKKTLISNILPKFSQKINKTGALIYHYLHHRIPIISMASARNQIKFTGTNIYIN